MQANGKRRWWRRWTERVMAAAIVMWALVLTSDNANKAAGMYGRRPDGLQKQADRYAALHGQLSVEHAYRYVLLPEDAAPNVELRGFGEYLLAPVHVATDSASPWLIVDGGDEPTLTAWLAGRDDLDVLARPGNGLLVARERRP